MSTFGAWEGTGHCFWGQWEGAGPRSRASLVPSATVQSKLLLLQMLAALLLCTSEGRRNHREQGQLREASQGLGSLQGSGLAQPLPIWPSFMLT